MQHKRGQRKKQDSSIQYAVVCKDSRGSEKFADRPDKDEAGNGDQGAADGSHAYKHGEVFICPLFLTLAQRLCHDGAAAGADHKAQCA